MNAQSNNTGGNRRTLWLVLFLIFLGTVVCMLLGAVMGWIPTGYTTASASGMICENTETISYRFVVLEFTNETPTAIPTEVTWTTLTPFPSVIVPEEETEPTVEFFPPPPTATSTELPPTPKPTDIVTEIPTEKPELPTVVPPTEKPELPTVVPPCKNPQDYRDGNLGDCNAGGGND